MKFRSPEPEKRLKVFSYVRVSSEEQAKGGSLNEQRRVIKEFCERNTLSIVDDIEDVETAAKSGRENFESMIKKLKQKRADGIVFHKVDRSTRNYRDWQAISELMDTGLYVAFAAESLESTTPIGRFIMDIMVAGAVQYIRNLKAEIKKGNRGRINQGLLPRSAPFGYLDPPRGTPKEKRCRKWPDPERAPLIKQMNELYATGAYTLGRLAATMRAAGLVNPSGRPLSISQHVRILDNPFYAGLISHEGQLYPGKHRPIISVELFERVQQLRKKKMHAMAYRHEHQLQQLLTCGHCERVLTPEIQKGYTYYRCHSRVHSSTSIREELVTTPVVDLLAAAQLLPEERSVLERILAENDHEAGQRGKLLRQQLLLEQNKLAAKRKRARDGFLSGTLQDETYKEVDAELLLAERKLSEQLAQLSTASPAEQQRKALLLFERLDLAYLSANKTEQRKLLQIACSNFSIEGKNVKIKPRKWLEVLTNRERFPVGAPDREKVRTMRTLLDDLDQAWLIERIYMEAISIFIVSQTSA